MNKIIVASITALALLVSTASCSWLKSEGAAAGSAAAACAADALGVPLDASISLQTIENVGESIGMAVLVIVATGGTNWQADLSALEAKYGAPLIQCALQVAEAVFRTAPAAGSAAPSTSDATQTPHDRAVIALAGLK